MPSDRALAQRGRDLIPDPSLLLLGAGIFSFQPDNTIKIWDAEAATGEDSPERAVVSPTDHVKSCLYSPDGPRPLSSSNVRTLKIWDNETGEELTALKSPMGYVGKVNECAFSPDGSHDERMKV